MLDEETKAQKGACLSSEKSQLCPWLRLHDADSIPLGAQLSAGLTGDTRESVRVLKNLTVQREDQERQRVGPQNRHLHENHNETSLYIDQKSSVRKADNTFCVGKDVGQPELSHVAGECEKWYNHFTESVTISCKSKHATVLDPASPLLRVSQEQGKHMATQRLVPKRIQ